MSALEIRRLKAFGMQVQGDACRDLELIKAIDETLDALDIFQERINQLNQAAQYFIDLVGKATSPIQGTVDLVALFEKGRDNVAALHRSLMNRRNSALNDPNLHDDDCVADAYTALINAVAKLHNQLNCLSWAIGENNADFDAVLEGAYSDANQLFAAMGA